MQPRPSISASPSARRKNSTLQTVFAVIFGAFLGLTLLKFSNPPIMEQYVEAPKDGWEFVLGNPWPITWGYAILTLVTVVGLFVCRVPNRPAWLLALPAAWFGWQWLSSAWSVTPELSAATVRHFAAGLVCFYLGC